MYSRYTPNASGGFDRRQFPDEADLRTAQGRAPPQVQEHNTDRPILNTSSVGAGFPDPPPTVAAPAGAGFPGSSSRPMRFRPASSRRPPPAGPGNSGTPVPPLLPGGLLGPDGLLGQLLPHGLDSEDLLILAILVLSMKQDGAAPTELLIAAGLYFWL